jgi:hypothetical protein
MIMAQTCASNVVNAGSVLQTIALPHVQKHTEEAAPYFLNSQVTNTSHVSSFA